MPLFSTIIPVFNRYDLLSDTLDSVLSQTFKDHEIIVVDDGSTDRTPELLKTYADRIRVIRQENQGQAVARNHAMTVAKGEYLIFLDSDDLFAPWTLQRFAEAITQYKQPALLLAPLQVFNVTMNWAAVKDGPLRANCYKDYLATWKAPRWLAPSATAVKREVFEKVGGFFQLRLTQEENDAWLRVADAPGFVEISAPICCARREHAANDSIFSPKQLDGGIYLLDAEDQGKYPGGRARRKERRSLITLHIRPLSIECLKRKQANWAWQMYRRTFMWNLSLGRLKYLLAFPVLALKCAIKK